jgi:antitoxin (DNA-binding transcriptional repressor) of toxin-antitoxin stability system
MGKATISEIKSRLSAYLKKVKAGQAVLILDRDHPVTRLERVGPSTHPDDRLVRLERAEILQRATRPVSVESLNAPVPQSSRSVVAALLEERQEGR